MSALDSLQPDECLHHLLSSELIELVLNGTGLDCLDAYPPLDLWATPIPTHDEREATDAVPLESRIHKYVQPQKHVPVQLMTSLSLSSFCDELRTSLTQLTTRKVLIADRIKPKVLLKEVKGEIEILMRKAARRQKGRSKNKENEEGGKSKV